MKRSSYRGEHKGSTLKARSKIWSTRALNSLLAIVLVVGLAPSMSFAGEQPVSPDPEPAAAAPTEEVVKQQEPVAEDAPAVNQPASETSDVPKTSEVPEAAEGATSETPGVPAVMAAQEGTSNISIEAPDGTKIIELQGGKRAYYAKEALNLTVKATNLAEGASVAATDNGSAATLNGSTADGTYSGTLEVAANTGEAETAHTIVVAVTSGGETKSETAYVVIDNKAPEVEVAWEPGTSDDWFGEASNSDVTFTTNEAGKSSVAAIATITVKDYNPSFPASSNTVLQGDGTTTTKLDTTDTSAELTASMEQGWTESKKATLTEPAEYTCKVKYAANTTLAENTAYNAKLGITTVDKGATAASTAADKSGTMKVTSVDTAAPVVMAKKGSAEISMSSDAPTYLKKDEELTVSVTDDNYDASKLTTKKLGDTELALSSTSGGGSITLTGGTDAPLTSDGAYTLAIAGTDKVNNAVTYNGYLVYDATNPTIAVTYTADGTKTLKAAGDEAVSGEAFIKDGTTVTVNLADAIALDTDAEKTYVKYRKGTDAATSATIEGGTASVPLTFEQDAVYTIEVKATDKAGNDTSYTATITMDNSVPTIDVAWTDTNRAVDGDVTYYSQRVAKVTIVDKHFNEATATAGLVYTGGKGTGAEGAIAWTTGGENAHIATITYDKNAKNCVLDVQYASNAGVEVVAAESSSITVSDGAYSAAAFSILANPIIDVTLSEETVVTKTQNTSASTSVTMPVYVLSDTTGTFYATVTVRDVAFDAGNYTLTNTVTPADASTAAIQWSATEEGSITHTGTITYSADCEVSALSIALNADRQFIGSGQQTAAEDQQETVGGNATTIASNAWTYKTTISETEYTGFWVDNTPPTLISVTYNPENPVATGANGERYYKDDASAAVRVRERHLNYDGSPVEVKLSKSVDGGAATESTITATGADGVFTYAATDIAFTKEADKVATYTLNVAGTDLADKALVSTSDEGEVKTVMGEGNTYSRTVVVDAAKPTVAVTKGGEAVASGATVYTNGAAQMTATISDTLINTDNVTITATYKVNGEGEVQTLTLPEKPSGTATMKAGSWAYSFELPADDNADSFRTYTVSVSGKDAVGNAFEGNYEATIVVDPASPVLDVTLTPYNQSDGANPKIPFTVKADDQGVPTYYYNQDVTASAKVTDAVQIDADGITAKVFGQEEKSTAGTSFQTAPQAFSTEGSKTIEVTGTDAAGNPLTAEEGSIAAAGLKDGAYKANVVVDKTKPTVAVTYTSGTTTDASLAYTESTAENDAVKVAGNVSIKATFTDANFDKDSVSIKYAVVTDGADGTPTDATNVSWDSSGKVATFSIDAPANAETTYQIIIDGKDLAGNDLAGNSSATETAKPYTSLVKVDNTPPKLTVTYTPAHKSLVAATDTANEKRYFDDDVTVAVSIEESDFDATKISINGTATAAVDWTPNEETHTYTLNTDKQPSYTADGTFEVSGTDLVGNPLVPATGADFTVNSSGLYKSSIIIDKYSPDVEVVMNAPRAGQADDVDYYDSVVTATITVKDKNFDAEGNKPGDVITVTPTGKVTIPTSWTAGTDSYSVDVTFEDSDFGKPYAIVVSGSDLVQHMFNYKYGDNSATENPAGNNYKTSATGDTLDKAYARSFFVDSMAPDVEIKMSEAKITTHDGRDYFGKATKNNQIVATITVTDASFLKDTATITNAAGNALAFSDWTQDGNAFITTVAFDENTDGAASTLKVVAADKVNTLKGDARKVTYSYGEPTVTGSATGGNVSTVDKNDDALTSSSFVLDMTAPKLSVKEAKGFATKWVKDKATTPYLFYTESGSGVIITMTDANDISKATAASPFALSGAGSDLGPTSTQTIELIQSANVTERDSNNKTMQTALVTTTDYVGNYSIWSISENGTVFLVASGSSNPENAPVVTKDGSVHPTVMVLDTTAPELKWGSTPTEGQFYKDDQSATLLVVNEINFDYLKDLVGGRVIATISRAENSSGSGYGEYRTITASDFKGSGGDWSAPLYFEGEGHYKVTAQFEDIAGNLSNPVSLNEFTIDRTAPVIQEITFDNNDVRNGKYYKAGRTATITVIEHNWDPSLFTITTNGSIGGWSDSGDTHTCTVSFTSDGTYNLSVSGSDRAGNAAESRQVEEFVVDLTAPTIDFSNVAGQTAYNAEIAPVINYHDEANFDANGMTWTLTGNKHGAQTFAAGQSSSGNDGTVSFSDFPREVEADDIYTLQAHLTDMAGNEADNSITFSVNRFGSNFIVLDEKTFTEHKGYLAEPIEVRVQEINVSGAQSEMHAASVTHGLTTENLERKSTGTPTSTGFYIESGTDSSGWATYTYHVGSGNFSDEGNYHVVLSSTDTATNLNNSASYYNPEQHKVADAEVSFILDTTDPIIEGISVSDGQTKDAGAERLTFTVTDNIGFDTVKVVVDGEEQTVEPEMGGLCVVDLPAKAFAARDMQIIATDLAGRTAEAAVLGFHWTDNIFELHLPLVLGGLAVIVAAVVGGVFFVRRRNGQ